MKSLRNRQRTAQNIPFLTRDKSLINAAASTPSSALVENHDENFRTRNELEENKLFEDITNDDL